MAELGELIAKLEITLDGLRDETKNMRRHNERLAKLAEQPSYVPLIGSALIPANGFLVFPLNVSGPAQGYRWNVRRLSVAGATPSTAVAGRMDVFVSASPYGQFTDFNSLSMADWVDQASSLPLVASYGEGELELHSPERLHLVVSGGTSGQRVYVSGRAQQVQEQAASQQWNV